MRQLLFNVYGRLSILALTSALAGCTGSSPSTDDMADAGSRPNMRRDSGPTVQDAGPDARLQLKVTPTQITLSENMEMTTVEVSCASAPSEEIEVTVSTNDVKRINLTNTTYRFTPLNFSIPQQLTFITIKDSDLADNNVAVVLTAPNVETTTVSVTITDIDEQSFLVSTSSITMPEGGTTNFSLRLAAQPAEPTAVTLQVTDPAVTIVPPAVIFSPDNYDERQTITLIAEVDANATNDTSSIQISSPLIPSTSVSLTVLDNSSQNLVVTPASLSLNEGATESFNVSLTQPAAQSISVEIISNNNNAVTTVENQITFAPGEMGPIPVTVVAQQDANASNEQVELTITAANLTARTIQVDVTDDDTQSIELVPPGSLQVSEGQTGSFAVRLAYAPSGPFQIDITSSNPTAGIISPAQLTFMPGNYNRLQTVSFTALDDNDAQDNNVLITVSPSNDPSVQSAFLAVQIQDDETQSVVFTPQTLTVDEGTTGSFLVSIAYPPATNITVTLNSSDPSIATVSPQVLFFTPTNYNQPQSISVSTFVDENSANDTATIVASTPGLPPQSLSLTVRDLISQTIITTPQALSVNEGDASQSFAVSLTVAPSNPVNILVASGNSNLVQTSVNQLVFNASNFNVPQIVNLTVLQDDNVANELTNVSLSASGLPFVSVPISITDDDTQSIIVTPQAVTVGEGQNSNIAVRLAYAPAANTELNVTSLAPDKATVNQAVLTFTPQNYSTSQLVTITGEQDNDGNNETTTVQITSAGLTTEEVSVTVTDDDSQVIEVGQNALTLNEGDGPSALSVNLRFQPNGNEVVTVTNPNPSSLEVIPSQLVFTPSNYSTPQDLQIRAIQDQNPDNETVLLSVSATGVTPALVTVSTVDDDEQQLIVSLNQSQIAEGTNGTLSVRLAFPPSSSTPVTISSSNPGSLSANPTVLNFDGNNYAVAQTVNLTALNEANDVDETVDITISANAAPSVTRQVTLIDDDKQRLVVTPQNLSLTEGQFRTFSVRLYRGITAPESVTISSSDAARFVVTPSILTFSPSNALSEQTITVSAAQDDDLVPNSATLQLTSNSTPEAFPSQSLSINAVDNDVQSVVLSRQSATFDEGTTTTFTLRMAYEPASPTTVNLQSSNPAVASITPTQVIFSPSDYATPQTITISAPTDADVVPSNTSIEISSTDFENRSFAVTVTDPDQQAISVSANQITVAENDSSIFSVQLAYEPVSNVTVNLVSTPSAFTQVSPVQLTFTPGNYNSAQQVTLNTTADGTTNQVNGSITLTAAGIPNEVIQTTITNTESNAMSAQPSSLTAQEGETVSLSLALSLEPATNEQIAITNPDPTRLSISPATLTFTPGNYSTPQALTITILEDTDLVDHQLSIELSNTNLGNLTIPIAITDTDSLEIETSVATLTVAEEGTNTLDVRLSHQPNQTTIVSVTAGTGLSTGLNQLVFDSNNWNQFQTITVSANADNDLEDITTDLSLSATGVPTVTTPILIEDDDVQTIIASTQTITVAEESSTQFSIRLAYAPTQNENVTLAVSNPLVVATTPSNLTFTASNYTVPQIVTVQGLSDADTEDGSAAIILGSASASNVSVSVNVADNDTQTLVLTSSNLNIEEGATATVGISLGSQPLTERNVTISAANSSLVVVSPATLSFSPSNFATSQIVTVRALEDTDAENESTTLAIESTDVQSQSVSVSITDDDIQSIFTTQNSISMSESGSGTIGVRLTAAPASAVTVTVQSSDTTIASVAPATLTFDSSNWTQLQYMTVSGVSDTDDYDEVTSVVLSATGIPATVVAVNVTDLNNQLLIVTPANLSMNEGANASVSVRLLYEPEQNVTVTAVFDSGILSVAQPNLTFTPSNFNTPQNLVISAVEDANMVNNQTSLSVTSAGLTTRNVSISVVDNDEQGIALNTSGLTVQEGGTASFNVQLQFQPFNDVVVSVLSNNVAAFRPNSSRLRFTPSDWDVPRVIQVDGLQDADLANETGVLLIRASGLRNVVLPVTVTDDDTQSFVLSNDSIQFGESSSGAFNVSLSYQPSSDVVVNVVTSDQNAVSPSPTSLTFTSANYDTPQVVSLSSTDDTDLTNESATITVSAAGLTSAAVAVTVIDDDVQNFLLSTSALSLNEQGASSVIDVSLTQQPAGNIVTNVLVSNPDLNINPTSITFTPSNWNTPQQINLNAANDLDTLNETAQVEFSASGVLSQSVSVTIIDNDTQAILVAGTPSANEGGNTTLSVTLAYPPVNNTTVTIATDSADLITLSTTELVFTPQNYNQAQTITVTASEDNDLANEQAEIRLTLDTQTQETVSIQITDNDSQSIITSSTTPFVGEGGASSITIALAYVPSSTVTIVLASSDSSIVSVSPTTLTFAPQQGGSPQSVSLTAASDANTVSETVTLSVTTTHAPDLSLVVTTVDDDELSIQTSVEQIALGEGTQSSFNVTLSHVPPGNTTLAIATSNSDVVTISPSTLIFSASNFSVPQTVTIEAPADLDLINQTAQLSFSSAGLTTKSVLASVTDDDEQSILFSQTSVNINESESGSGSLRLAYQPSSDVVVSLVTSNPTTLSVSPQTLVFTPSNYASPQNISLTANPDQNLLNENILITASTPGASSAQLTANVIDDDTQAVEISRASLQVTEGTSESISVNLRYAPLATTQVTITSNDPQAATADRTSLTFTPQNFASPQLVNIVGEQDLDATDESVSFSVTDSESSAAGSFSVSIQDDEVQTIVVDPTILAVTEGGSVTFSVRMRHSPTNPLVVGIASPLGSSISTTPSTLNFDASNYTTPQTVTVDAAEDANTVLDLFDLELSSPNVAPTTLTVQVNDNDTQEILLAESAIVIDEGSTQQVGLRLAYEPNGNQTISVSDLAGTLSIVPSTLTFTPGNYNQLQTINISSPEDDNLSNETFTVAASATGIATSNLDVTVVDNDSQSFIVSGVTSEVQEGSTGTFSVALAYEPNSNTTVSIASQNVGAITVSNASLTFTPANYSQAQTVTFTANQDQDTADEQGVIVAINSPNVPTYEISLTVSDDDTQRLVASPSAITVVEGGVSAQLAITLAYQPSVNETVTFSAPASLNLSPSTISFTPQNYETAQTLTVSANEDDNLRTETEDLTATLASNQATSIFSVTVTDNDSQELVVSQSSFNVNEGTITPMTFSLRYEPIGTEEIVITSDNPQQLTSSPNTLTFTAANYSNPQTVNLIASEDLDLQDSEATLLLDGTTTGTSAISVTMTDTDELSLLADNTNMTINEGNSDNVGISLSHQPTSTVTVTLVGNNSQAIALNITELIFTPANFATQQTVSLSALEDPNVIHENVIITASSPGLSPLQINVQVSDDDSVGILANPTQIVLQESSNASQAAVRLTRAPTNPVQVSATSQNSNVAVVTPAILSFNSTNWATPQTISIVPVDDVNIVDDDTSIILDATGIAPQSISVTVEDDDNLEVLLSTSALSLLEGQTHNLQVRLSHQPTSQLALTVSTSSATALSLSPQTLVFGPSNYATPQVVNITAQHDSNLTDTNSQISLSGGSLTKTLTVHIKDDDDQVISLNPPNITTAEEEQETIQVALDFVPRGPVTVSVASNDPQRARVTPSTISFTPSNYSVAQNVVVNLLRDSDLTANAVNVTVSGATANDATATLQVQDIDTQAIIVSASTLTLNEGASRAVEISLAYQPSAATTVTVASTIPNSVETSVSSLQFTPSNYDTPQTLVIEAVADNNTSDESATVSLTTGLITENILVTTIDNDLQAFITSVEQLNVTEGQTQPLGVRLAYAPSANVVVSLAANSSLGLSPSSLLFTPSNYAQPQTVTVTGEHDQNLVSESVNLSISAANIPSKSVSVVVTDDDTQSINLSTGSLELNEGSSESFTVTLAYAPTQATVVNLTHSNSSVTFSPDSLTFDASNYDSPQQITASAQEDNNASPETFSLQLNSTAISSRLLPVAVSDNDTQSVVLTDSSINLQEGQAVTLGVQLAFAPVNDFTVSFSISDDSRLDLSPSSLTFTANNYQTNQTLTLTGLADLDTVANNLTLTITGPGMSAQTLPVTLTDIDEVQIVATPQPLQINEGSTGQLTVRLSHEPTSNVALSVQPGSSTPISTNVSSLIFTPNNYDQPQIVVVEANTDSNTTNESTTVTLAGSGLQSVQTTVNITDTDTQNILASPTNVTAEEEGSATQFGVRLAQQPSADVTVAIAELSSSQLQLNPANLTFTAANWSSPQNVSVSVVSDDNVDNELVTVQLSAPGIASQNLSVNIEDNDTQAMVADVSSLSLEEGESTTIRIRLAFEPSSNVTVTPISTDGSRLEFSPPNLLFTASDYSTPKSVTVIARQDSDLLTDNTVIELRSNNIASLEIPATIVDDDELSVVVVSSNLPEREGDSGEVFVALSHIPTATVSVGISTNAVSKLTTSPVQLTFYPSDFDVSQRISLTSLQDLDVLNELISMTLSPSEGSPQTLQIPILDDDTQDIVVSSSQLSITEEGTASLTVSLSNDPGAQTNVTVTSGDSSLLQTQPSVVTFTSANFRTPQTIVLNAPADADAADNTVTLTLSGAGGVSKSVSIQINDNDTQSYLLSESSLSIQEGTDATVQIALAHAPTASDYRVDFTPSNPGKLSISPAFVTFSAANYNTPQTITVSGLSDQDLRNELGAVQISSSGIQAFDLPVTVVDDDEQEVIFSQNPISINEGTTLTVGFRLAFEPTSTATFALTAQNPSKLAISSGTAVFTPENYSTQQQLQITANEDNDSLDELGQSVNFVSESADPQSLAVNILDDDVQAFVLNANSLTLIEGQQDVITVRLAYNPLSDVTVSVSSTDNARLSTNPVALTFTPNNFDTPQNVQVLSAQDSDIETDDVQINLASSAVPTNASVAVTIQDDDVLEIQTNLQSVAVSEGGEAELRVRLSHAPSNTTSLNISTLDPSSLSTSPTTLQFTAANFDTEQIITLIGVEDVDTQGETNQVALSIANGPSAAVSVAVSDNDTLQALVNPASVNVTEGQSAAVEVRLSHAPNSNLQLALALSDPSKAELSAQQIIFTPANYQSLQTVWITGTNDVDQANENLVLSLSSQGLTTLEVPVSVLDDDSLNLNLSESSLRLTEGGASQTFEVTLTSQPATAFTVSLSATSNVISISPSTFTIQPSSWQNPQTITVTPNQDNDTVDTSATINIQAPGVDSRNVEVVIEDDDEQTIVSSVSAINLQEGGNGTFTVSLQYQPTTNTAVTVLSGNSNLISVQPTSLTFTQSNYNIGQTVTLSASEDVNLTNDASTVILRSTGSAERTVPVNIADNDTQRLIVAPSSLSVTEGDSTSLSVRLEYQPANTVNVALAANEPNLLSLGQNQLVFTTNNYAQAQVVQVTALEDVNLRNEVTEINLDTTGLNSESVSVNIADNDTQTLVLSPNAITMDEGSSETIALSLSYQPNSNVSLSVSNPDSGRLTLNRSSFSFTPSNWNSPQYLTIQSLADDDADDNNLSLSFSGTRLSQQSFPVSVTDTDEQALIVSRPSITITEGSSNTFTARLAQRPSSNTTVTLSSNNPAVTISPSSFVVNTSNFTSPRTVSISSPQDNDLADALAEITVETQNAPSVTVSVLVDDDDEQEVVVNPAAIAINEGASADIDISLRYEPMSDTAIQISSQSSLVTSSPNSLTFTPLNWNIPQSARLTAQQDPDTLDNDIDVSITSSVAPTLDVDVAISDDDTQTIVLNNTSVTVTEGQTANIEVSLSNAPVSPVTISVVSGDSSRIRSSVLQLTFTSTTYQFPQTVSIQGLDDLDIVDNHTTLSFTSPGLTTVVADITSADDDTQALLVTPGAVSINEGQSSVFSVRLAYQPAQTTEVAASHTSTKFSLSSTTLTFESSNYDVEQTITISALQDSDSLNDAGTVSLSAPSISNETLSVTIIDDDAISLVATPGTLSLNEGGLPGYVNISLSEAPTSPIALTLESSDSGAVSFTPNSYTFTQSNWNTPLGVQVVAIADNDTSDESVELVLSSSALPTRRIPISVSDDDQMSLIVSQTTLALNEGASDSIDISLSNQPTSNITVSITSSRPNRVVSSASSVTFTPSNYNSPQSITVSAIEDPDLEDDSGNIVFFVNQGLQASTSVQIADNDTQSLIVSETSISINEGNSANVGVRLAFQPSSNVTVNLSASPSQGLTLSQNALTFTPANYAQIQAITVSAAEDANLSNEVSTLTVSSTGLTPEAVQLTIIDDDTQSLIVSQSNLDIDEGTSESVTVRLAYQPQNTVNVSLASSDINSFAVNPSSLSFSASNYATPRVVSITAYQDFNAEDETGSVTLSATGLPTASIALRSVDDDIQSVLVTPSSISLQEGNNTNVSLRLAQQPTQNVVIQVESSDSSALSTSVSSVTFTPTNYGTPQAITLTAEQDADTVNGSATVTFSATGIAPTQMFIPITDDDTQSIVLSNLSFNISEGSSGQLQVSLAYAPQSPISVNISSMDIGAVSANPSSIQFTPANYNVTQTVSIIGVEDADTEDEQDVFVEILSPGVTTEEIVVNVTDDDIQSLIVTPASLTVTEEDGSTQFFVSLAYEPSGQANVSISNSNTPAVSLDRTSLSFNSQNYANPQPITVTALSDANTSDAIANFTVSSPVANVNRTVACNIIDDDIQEIVLNRQAILVEENAQESFQVSLRYAPSGPVIVNVSSNRPDILVTSRNFVTFNASNYDTPVTVTVNSLPDNDADDDLAVVSLTSNGIQSNNINVSIQDTNIFQLLASTDHGTVAEGGSTTFTLRLGAAPSSGTQTVTFTSQDPLAATVSPASIDFDATNYQTDQTITITSLQDPDPTDELVLIDIESSGMDSLQYELTVNDDDTVGLSVSPTSLTIAEGATSSFNISLSASPQVAVPVTIESSTPNSVITIPEEIVFLPNGPTTISVQVSALEDFDPVNQSVLLTVTSTLTLPTSRTVGVSTTDNDTINAVFDTSVLTQLYTVTMNSPSDYALIQIDADSEVYLSANTGAPTMGSCNADTLIRVFDFAGTELGLDDNDGLNNCSSVIPGTDSFALLSPGDYFITVEEAGRDGIIPVYQLELTASPANVCGNNILEAGEFCDDGNNVSNDGCSATCDTEYSIAVATTNAITLHSVTSASNQAVAPFQTIASATSSGPTWEPTGTHIAVSDTNDNVRVYHTGTGQQTATFPGTEPQYSLTGAEILATDTAQACFRMFDVVAGTHACISESGSISSARWDPSGQDRWAFVGPQNSLTVRSRDNTFRVEIETGITDYAWALDGSALVYVRPSSGGASCEIARTIIPTAGQTVSPTVLVTDVGCSAKVIELTAQNAILLAVADSSGHLTDAYRVDNNLTAPVTQGSLNQLFGSAGAPEDWALSPDGVMVSLLVNDFVLEVRTIPSETTTSGASNTIVTSQQLGRGIIYKE
ncbi:MAG: myxococcus cysteine-rich repeat containing protein [Myxococcota bacterium]|nr:myxococcus cysteine-rich repeat containing protein [Myxococcota bacterium]